MFKGNTFYLVLITLIAATGGFLFGFDMAVISGALTFVQSQYDLTAVQEGHPQHFGSLPFFASLPFGSSIRWCLKQRVNHWKRFKRCGEHT